MPTAVSKAKELSAIFVPVVTTLGFGSAAITVNEMILRNFGVPSLFGRLRTEQADAIDSLAFSSAPLVIVLYALAVSVAAFASPYALRDTMESGSNSSRAGMVLVASSITAILAGFGMAFLDTSALAGPDARVFYFGIGPLWAVALGMRSIAARRNDNDMVFEWTLHTAGFAFVPALALSGSIPVVLAGYTFREGVLTGYTLGFGGIVFSTFAVCILLRALPRRTVV